MNSYFRNKYYVLKTSTTFKLTCFISKWERTYIISVNSGNYNRIKGYYNYIFRGRREKGYLSAI